MEVMEVPPRQGPLLDPRPREAPGKETCLSPGRALSTCPTSRVKVQSRYPGERHGGDSEKLPLSHLVCVAHVAKTINMAHPGASPWVALGIPQQESPPPSSFLSPWQTLGSFLLEGGPWGPGGYKGPGGGRSGTASVPSTRTAPRDSPAQVSRGPYHGWGQGGWQGSSLCSGGLSSLQGPDLQPEAMLLWLTLTLLWSSPCWAGRKSGRVCPLLPFPRAPLLPQPGPGGWAQPLSQTNSSLRTVPSACRGCVPSGQTQPTCHCGLPPTPTHLVLCLEMFGNGKGSYFITSKDNETGITGIRVFVGPVGLIKR